MPDKQVPDSMDTAKEPVQEVTKVIPAKELGQPEIRTWQLNNLEKEKEQKELEQEKKVYDDLKQKLQPEIRRQTEILKKEAYELAKKEGFDAGYAEGKALGEQEGKEIALAEAEEALAPKIEQLDVLLSSLDKPYRLLEKKVFESLSNLALRIAEEVIQQKIDQSPEWILNIIQEAVSALNDNLSPIDILLNPKDYDLIAEYGPTFAESWNVQSSDKIESGTCKVKQDFSSIEHDWKHRFETMSVKLQAQALADSAKSEPDSD